MKMLEGVDDTEDKYQHDKNHVENKGSIEERLAFEWNFMKAQCLAMQQKEHIYRLFLQATEDVFLYENINENTIFVSEKFYSFFKMPFQTQFNKAEFMNAIYEEDRQVMNLAFGIVEQEFHEITFRLEDGITWINGTMKQKCDENGKILERVVCFQHIANQCRQKEELEYMAYHDSLTGFYNRNYFVEMLNKQIDQAWHYHQTLAVVYVDIDNFQIINDSLGFVSGDELIQQFSEKVKELLEDDMFVARINNDEFCLAILNPIGIRSVEQFYFQLRETIDAPFTLQDGSIVHFTVSVGASAYPEDGENALDLIKNAEIAMYEVKKHEKNDITFFDIDTLDHFLEDVRMEKELKEAIGNHEFVLYYQPQYDAKTKKLRGVEALLRWRKEDGSFVSPGKFIPVAEKNGTIVTIGDWVMEQAIKTIAHWQRESQFDGIMSINISTIQIRSDDFVRNLKFLIEKYQVNPEFIEIEITESVLIDDVSHMVAKISKMRAYGVKVSLDDFGTGYSSLSYLKDIPIDTLKIDKSFIDTVITERVTDIITQSVISMVKELGVETVAEGVETVEQLEYLKHIQCDNIQGFLLGRPMADIDVEKFLLAG